jgi:hypothetical protein
MLIPTATLTWLFGAFVCVFFLSSVVDRGSSKDRLVTRAGPMSDLFWRITPSANPSYGLALIGWMRQESVCLGLRTGQTPQRASGEIPEYD